MKKTLTNFQIEELRQQAEAILNDIDKGEELSDILAKIYINSLPDKSNMQGYLMASAAIESIKSFENDFNKALKNPDYVIEKKLNELAADKSTKERCDLWMNITQIVEKTTDVIRYSDIADDGIKKEKFADIEQADVSEQEATAEYEAELFNKAKETVKASGIIFSEIFNSFDVINTSETADDAVNFLLDIGIKEIDMRAIMTMLVYTNIKKNKYDKIPADITIDQVATLVCVEYETIKIAEALDEGTMSEKVAEAILDVLGSLVIIVLFCLALCLLLYADVSLLAECLILTFIVIPVIWDICFNQAGILYDVLDWWSETSGKIIKAVSVSFKSIRKELVKVKRFFTEDKVVTTSDKAVIRTPEMITT